MVLNLDLWVLDLETGFAEGQRYWQTYKQSYEDMQFCDFVGKKPAKKLITVLCPKSVDVLQDDV